MSDLRDALKRASGVTGAERPDHARIQSEGRVLSRRRAVSYALAATGAAALTVVGGLALADADLFGRDGGTAPAGPAPTVTEPSPSPQPEARITVESPQPGDIVEGEFRVTGTADVYEGTVSILVRDQSGKVIARTFATATCGTGCRGRFTKRVVYESPGAQLGSVEVYSESAETGDRMFLVAVPLRLSAT
jgi:hypothetical protein